MSLDTIWQKYLHFLPSVAIYGTSDKFFPWIMIEAISELWSKPSGSIYCSNTLS